MHKETKTRDLLQNVINKTQSTLRYNFKGLTTDVMCGSLATKIKPCTSLLPVKFHINGTQIMEVVHYTNIIIRIKVDKPLSDHLTEGLLYTHSQT